MKPDVLTLAAAIFVIGLLASGLGLTEVFGSKPEPVVAGLQQTAAPLAVEGAESEERVR